MAAVRQSWGQGSARPSQASALSFLSLDGLICSMGMKHEVPKTQLNQDARRGIQVLLEGPT